MFSENFARRFKWFFQYVTRNFKWNLIPELLNAEILELLNEDKISELRNSKILFSLKIPSYEKLTKK